MDTSEIFIKMCDCEEIQKFRACEEKDYPDRTKWEDGDFYYIPRQNIVYLAYPSGEDPPPPMFNPMWLPRQDQIQEMMGEPQNCRYLLKRLNEWAVDHTYGWMLNASMEQLWLAFYMHEKHGRVWDGEKWRKK